MVHGAFLAKHAVAGARAGSGALLSMQHSNIGRFGPKKNCSAAAPQNVRHVTTLALRMHVRMIGFRFVLCANFFHPAVSLVEKSSENDHV